MTDTDDILDLLGDEPLTIVELRASNVMRIEAVDITPDPDDSVVIIGGRNAQGKTSVLRSIAVALGGAAAAKGISQPIRHGEDEADITIDLGKFIVRRHFDASKRASSLTVTTADGRRFSSPQAFLDAFLGDLTFDPLAFMRLPAKEQLATLLPLVDLPFDLDDLDSERAEHYEARTIVGRERDSLRAQAEAAPPPEKNLPAEEVSTEALLAEHRAATSLAAKRRECETLSDSHLRSAQHYEARIVAIDAELERLRIERDECVAGVAASMNLAEQVSAEGDAIEVPDIADIERRLTAVESTNAAVRAAAEHRRLWHAAQAKIDEYDGLTFLIAEIDGRKTQAIADAAMPIDGLSFDDKQVLYQGVPLPQCSAAEQLRVSMAIGMAANPTIRVMLISDASLLDNDSMAAVTDMARAAGYQMWLEKVGVGDPATIIIEDGKVVDRDEYERLRGD